jgi:hypothetical protein
MTTRALGAAAVGCACLSAALIATWPLALKASNAIPLGTELEPTVPLFNLWSIWWTADRAAHGFAGYWDAPFFYPNKGVFTYSEPQPLTGFMVAPLWFLGAPPALIYNLAVWALLTLNGIFGYRLARALELPRPSALLGAVMTVTLPFVANVSGVLPITALFGLLWTLEGLVRFGVEGTTRSALWAAAGFLAVYLTCQQCALLFASFAFAAGLVALSQNGYRMGAVLRLASSGLLAGLIVLWVALPAMIVHAELGFRRPERIVHALSARPRDFLTRPATASVKFPPPDPADTAGLFPGAILSALAVAGAAIGLRDPRRRRWTAYLIVSAAIAGLLALGLNFKLGEWRPFAAMRAALPGMDRVRSPVRFAAIMQLCLPTLAAMALERVRQLLPPRNAAGIVALAGVLAAGENLAVPARLTHVPTTPRTPWSAWIRARPDPIVLAHVPFPGGLHVSDYEIEAWRLFAQIDHHKPMANGYSGYFPQVRAPDGSAVPTYTRFQLDMATRFPDRRLLCVMGRSLGVNTLVIDRGWLADHRGKIDAYTTFLRPIHSDDQVRIYALSVPEGGCKPGSW